MIAGLAKVGKILYAHRAGIALGVGVGVGVTAIVHSSYKSVKCTPKIIDDHKKMVDDIKKDAKPKEEMTKEEKKAYDKQITKAYRTTAWRLFKNYAVDIGLTGVSAGATIYSYKTLKCENAKLEKALCGVSAAYANICKKFDSYRDYVIENYGEQADFDAMNDINSQFEFKDGKKTRTIKSQGVQLDDIHFVFDQRWGEFKIGNANANYDKIKMVEWVMQEKLDNNAVDCITIDEIARCFCSVHDELYKSFPAEWDLIGYVPGDQVELEVDYDHTWNMNNPYGDDIPAPPITITLKNATMVGRIKKPNDPVAEALEDCYLGYLYNLRMETEEKCNEVVPDKIVHDEEEVVA